jgi:hypothetical protein
MVVSPVRLDFISEAIASAALSCIPSSDIMGNNTNNDL